MTFDKLIEGLQQRQEQAFKELVYSYSKRFMTLARIYASTEEDAQDILQDAYVVIYKKIPEFNGDKEAALYGWVKRIIINLCMSKNQKMYRKMEKCLDNEIINKSIESMAESNLSHAEIMSLVFDLPDGYRQIFALYAIEGFTHKEIAIKLGIGENNSRLRYMRSRNMLKDRLEIIDKVVQA